MLSFLDIPTQEEIDDLAEYFGENDETNVPPAPVENSGKWVY